MTAKSKKCSICGQAKVISEFYAVGAQCKECKRERARARYREDPATKRAKNLAWYYADYAANPEKYAERRAREIASGRRAELVRDWRARNGERSNDLARRWREENRERLRELGRASYARDPEKYIERAARRRAATSGVDAIKVDLESLWTGSCGICGNEMDRELPYPDPMSKSLDHILPLSRGGSHVQSNCQWAHLRCNVSKGAKLPDGIYSEAG